MSDDVIQKLKDEISNLKNETIQPSQPISASINNVMSSVYDDSLVLSSIVVLFGTFILACATYLIKREKQADQILRLFGTILIIIGSLFLIVAGYSEKQIAPVIGLLGTIAGYILGKDAEKKLSQSQEKEIPFKNE